jgi:hypothetical protein
MNDVNTDLTLFRWWRPDPQGDPPEWYEAEPWLELLPKFEPLSTETRWMTWDGLASARITYSPLLDAPELWRVFVALSEGEAAYLEFAKKYGPLTHGENLISLDLARQFGVPYYQWRLAHRTMRSAWLVYEAVQSNRTNLLSEWIHIDDKRARFVGQPVPGHVIRHGAQIASASLDLLKVWSRHVIDVRSPAERLRRLAKVWIWRIVNLCMRGPQEGSLDSLAGGQVKAMLDVNFEGDLRSAAVRFNPTDLLGAMWFQFAKTIEGNLRYRQCRSATCRGWFLLSPIGAGKRQHSQFCSDGCRLRHWRATRRREARINAKGRAHASTTRAR